MDLKNQNLILVSNAEPYTHKKGEDEIKLEKLPGGLTSAMDPLMQEINGIWIAWGRGEADFEALDSDNKLKVPDEDGYDLKRVRLSEDEVEGFYLGFSNRMLWPICHSFPEKSTIGNYPLSKENWKIYKRVNRKYADAVIEEFSEGDFIWAHDYHLALLPKMIREEYPEANISIFWHIPWPPWEMFGSVPWGEEIIRGLLESDLVGFHTSSYVNNFLSCAEKLDNEVDWGESIVEGAITDTRVSPVPLGIEYDFFSNMEEKEKVKEKRKYLKDEINAENIIVSVDRLDYTKGVPQRLKAFRYFLKENPEFQRKASLVQRIPPSRRSVKEYQSILDRINRIEGEINGKLGRANWVPVRSYHRFLPSLEELVPYYLIGDVCLVTSLIDGMNLVCKEYTATVDDGVLILSKFAGAYEELKEDAIIVNPYNAKEVSKGIKKALTMPEEERKRRLGNLEEKVKTKNLTWWRKEFINKWQKNNQS